MNLTARDIMNPNFTTLSPDQDLREAARTFLRQNLSAAAVLDEQAHLVGILSEKDCMPLLIDRAFGANPRPFHVVADRMTRAPVTVSPDVGIAAIATLFHQSPFRQVPVIDRDRMIGIVTRRDVLSLVERTLAAAPQRGTAQQCLITQDIITVVGPATNVVARLVHDGR